MSLEAGFWAPMYTQPTGLQRSEIIMVTPASVKGMLLGWVPT